MLALVVVVSDSGIRRQIGDVRGVVSVRANPIVQDGRQQGDAIELHAVVVERGHQRGRAWRSIGLAEEKLRGVPSLVQRDVADDELIKCTDVLIDTCEVLDRPLADGAREPRQRSIDEDEVALVDEAELVGDDLKRRRASRVRARGDDADRAERSHVQECRRGPGAAVIEESDGASCGVRAVLGVGNVKDAAVRLVLVVLDQQVAGGCGVVNGLPTAVPVVLGDGGCLRGNGNAGVIGLCRFVRRIGGCRRLPQRVRSRAPETLEGWKDTFWSGS